MSNEDHKVLDLQTMAELGKLVEQAAGGKPVRPETMERLARERGLEVSHLYAAAGGVVEFAREHKVSFVVCAGACQSRGALACLQHLLELRDARKKAWFKKSFDVETRGCLDRCDHGPVVRVHTRDGTAYVTGAGRDELDEAVKELL